MDFEKKEIYVETSAGDIILVELSENNGNIRVMVNNRIADLEMDSAIDLADAVLQLASEIYDD